MKNLVSILSIVLVLSTPLTFADTSVYKCMGPEGNIQYQEEPCGLSSKAGVLTVQSIDPQVVKAARKRLARELEVRASYEQQLAIRNEAEALQELEQRKLDALERTAEASDFSANSQQNQQSNSNNFNGYQDPYFYQWKNMPYSPALPNNNQTSVRPGPNNERRNVYRESINSTQFPNKFR